MSPLKTILELKSYPQFQRVKAGHRCLSSRIPISLDLSIYVPPPVFHLSTILCHRSTGQRNGQSVWLSPCRHGRVCGGQCRALSQHILSLYLRPHLRLRHYDRCVGVSVWWWAGIWGDWVGLFYYVITRCVCFRVIVFYLSACVVCEYLFLFVCLYVFEVWCMHVCYYVYAW